MYQRAVLTPSEVIVITSGVGELRSPTSLRDDWKIDCQSNYSTTVSRYEASTGKLLVSRTFNDLLTATVHLDAAGKLYIGGSRGSSCAAEGKGFVGSLGPRLDLVDLYSDATPSIVKAIAELPGRRFLIGLNESNRFDILPAAKEFIAETTATLSRQTNIDSYETGRVVELDADGSPSAELTLDAGSDLFIHQIDAQNPRRITVAGGVGGEAALFVVERADR
jgi:hypothetical protein